MLDLWKAANGQHYLGIVICFITADWVYHSVALGTSPINDRHTSENIKNDVVKVLLDFGVTPTVYVADNASNQVKCNDMLSDWSNTHFFDVDGDDISDEVQVDQSIAREVSNAFRIEADSWGCHCHHLELVIKNAIEKVPAARRTIAWLKDISSHSRRSDVT